MSKRLDEMAARVAEDQAAIDGDLEDTRTRVIRMGKELRAMQKEQKAEQNEAKAHGETPVPWKDWVDEEKRRNGAFPSNRNCNRYALISKYPKAYEKGMAIDQAYRAAGQWKKNGGAPPDKQKKTVTRTLGLIGKAAGQLERRIEQLVESETGQVCEVEKWTDDEIEGTLEAVTLAKQSCNLLIRQLNGLYENA